MSEEDKRRWQHEAKTAAIRGEGHALMIDCDLILAADKKLKSWDDLVGALKAFISPIHGVAPTETERVAAARAALRKAGEL